MPVLAKLNRDKLLLLGCECDRHGLNKRQFNNTVKRGNKSWSQPFAVGLVVAVPAAQGGVAGVGEKKWQHRRFNVAIAKYHVGFALMANGTGGFRIVRRMEPIQRQASQRTAARKTVAHRHHVARAGNLGFTHGNPIERARIVLPVEA